jgi:hypothetical protein
MPKGQAQRALEPVDLDREFVWLEFKAHSRQCHYITRLMPAKSCHLKDKRVRTRVFLHELCMRETDLGGIRQAVPHVARNVIWLADEDFGLDAMLLQSLVDREEVGPGRLQLPNTFRKIELLHPHHLLLGNTAQPAHIGI